MFALSRKVEVADSLQEHRLDAPGSAYARCDAPELVLRERCLWPHCANLTDTESCQARANASISLLDDVPTCDRRSRFFFHLFWSGPMKRTIALTLWSLLWSQHCARVILWHMGLDTLQSGAGFQLLQPFKLFHQVREGSLHRNTGQSMTP
jgi:hypothetical protein